MKEELDKIPPRNLLKFGEYEIDKGYREALYEAHPHYTAEEIVGSYLGYGTFMSQDEWMADRSAK